VQADVIPIDRDHDHRWIGEIVYLERDKGGNLWAVGHVRDDVLPIVHVGVGSETVAVETDLYWSASRIGTEEYEDIVIDSVALTASPARSAAQPVKFLPGALDHRHVAGKERWGLQGREHDLLTRAACDHLDRRAGAPLYVRSAPGCDDLLDLNHRSHPAEIAQALEEQQWERGRPPGKLKHSAPYRGIIAVR